MYSLEDLEIARKELKRWDDAFANDSSNNPEKYESQRREARRNFRLIIEELKRAGHIEKTDSEILGEELDRLYPNAKSKTIVQHNGTAYQIRYFPVERSRSRKSVNEWGHEWTAIVKPPLNGK
ncbi:hypothetical protein [Herbaspirillum seropedicae]|uniref:hypothetical protein n=1 Tax=Herbaspirillum seropedicae TaxID=964 RepID=UPI003FCE393B